MKVYILFISFIFLCLFPETVLAQPIPMDKPPVFSLRCGSQPSPAAQMDCLNERVAFAQDTLNHMYDKVQQGIDDRELLNLSQNAWVTYKDQTCKFQASLEIEAYQRSKELECIGQLTEDRAMFFFYIQHDPNQHVSALTQD